MCGAWDAAAQGTGVVPRLRWGHGGLRAQGRGGWTPCARGMVHRLGAVTNAMEAATCRHGDSVQAQAGRLEGGGGVPPPPSNAPVAAASVQSGQTRPRCRIHAVGGGGMQRVGEWL